MLSWDQIYLVHSSYDPCTHTQLAEDLQNMDPSDPEYPTYEKRYNEAVVRTAYTYTQSITPIQFLGI